MFTHPLRILFATAALLAFAGPLAPSPASAQSAQSAQLEQDVIDAARNSVHKLRSDPDLGALNTLLARAKGVLVFPSLLKAGFFFGAEGGSGVLLARDERGTWSAPAFYTMGSGSFGLQFGVQQSENVLVIMTDRGLEKVLSTQFKLGLDAGVALGPVGRGVAAATTLALGADIYAYSNARGLFGGVALDGSVIYPRDDWNRAYYGQPVSAREIVIQNKVTHAGVNELRVSLAAR